MLASLVAHHRFGDVLEELNEILLRVHDHSALICHDVEERSDSCRRLDDRLSLIFWWPKLVLSGHLTGTTGNAFFSTSKILIHEVVWHHFIITSIVMFLA